LFFCSRRLGYSVIVAQNHILGKSRKKFHEDNLRVTQSSALEDLLKYHLHLILFLKYISFLAPHATGLACWASPSYHCYSRPNMASTDHLDEMASQWLFPKADEEASFDRFQIYRALLSSSGIQNTLHFTRGLGKKASSRKKRVRFFIRCYLQRRLLVQSGKRRMIIGFIERRHAVRV